MSAAALQLDAAISDVWRDYLRGAITEAEADHRTAALAAQRRPGIVAGPLRRLSAVGVRRFARHYQRSPDREASLRRRRVLARDGHTPPDVRSHYTEGECAVLTVIAGEVKRQGVCDWPIDKIAAIPGVCRTTAQNAIRKAAQLHHITVQHRPVKGRKSLTNVIRIVSPEWSTWIEHGPGTGFKTMSASKFLNTTKNLDLAGDAEEGGTPTRFKVDAPSEEKKAATEIEKMVKASGCWPEGGRREGWNQSTVCSQLAQFLTAGITPAVILNSVQDSLERASPGPIHSFQFFVDQIARDHAAASAPVSLSGSSGRAWPSRKRFAAP